MNNSKALRSIGIKSLTKIARQTVRQRLLGLCFDDSSACFTNNHEMACLLEEPTCVAADL